ncbi:carboxylesterase/lipase family protein [Cryptosporangium aurantiacum]|nr:carboxylesterase family protein [Cryptosporangium aurantiacum]
MRWVATLLAAVLAVTTLSGTPSGPTARTESGPVEGVREHGVDSFLGIPYAAAPVGPLRWRPPRPAPRWAGVRDADTFGDRCAALASTNGPRTESEDCLFVNVQRPAGTKPGDRLPVYVFIHGGGLANGTSAQMDMATFVRRTGVIGVTFNYRLGVLGFLRHPSLGADSGNHGFQDQQAALRWVHRNIAAFGGSPASVTVGGSSAGGWSVCGHLTAPASRGLFARAMIQSGSCTSISQSDAMSAATAFARNLGCDTASCLRGRSTAALLDAGAEFEPRLVAGTPTLPVAPADAVRAGRFARVPLVLGANRDEGRTFALEMIGWSQAQYVAWVRGRFATGADAVLAHYPWPADADPFTPAYLVGAIFTDSGLLTRIGGCGTRGSWTDFARWTRVYGYEFAHRTGPGLWPIPGYVWGAGHAAELAYLWPSFDNGTPIAPTFDAAERRLAAEMTRRWGAFIRGGDPWLPYGPKRRLLALRADGQSGLIDDAAYAADHRCALWNKIRTP